MLLMVYAEKQLTKKVLFTFINMGKLGCSPSLKLCNCLLSNLVRNGESHVASYVYDQMVRVGIVPDVFTITIKVNTYCKDGRVCRAMEFVNYMDCREFELNVVAYNALIGGYFDLRDMEGVSRLLKLMSERRITNDVVTYTLLIKGFLDGYCLIGSIDDALRVQDELLSVGLKLNQVICNSLINGICKLRQVHKANQVIRDMGVRGLKLDSYSYYTLVDAFCKEDRVEKKFASVEMYNSPIKGVFKCKRSSKVNDLLVKMHASGLKPNAVTYGALIDGWCKKGCLVHCKGLDPNIITCNALINSLCKSGYLDRAAGPFYKLKKELGPNVVTYNTLIDGYP
ncbi:hypothetical protein GIB67_002558 [Kingdonia uniflora]|uniref:Pentatricopeptide repeat-containing protein n=1 Tax=Kingdonia uniflora TaxID=39325 RepID=A0A7J7N8X7_9MAGN|nr:hypothetical protein GIB67_002558 [Kingdonia uniflora]